MEYDYYLDSRFKETTTSITRLLVSKMERGEQSRRSSRLFPVEEKPNDPKVEASLYAARFYTPLGDRENPIQSLYKKELVFLAKR